MRIIPIAFLFLLFVPIASAYNTGPLYSYKGHYLIPEDEIILFAGSGFHYDNIDKYGSYFQFYDMNLDVPNLNNRYVVIRLLHNGYWKDSTICYNRDYCYIGNLKLKINHIFQGKEATAVFLNIVKIYGD